MKLTAYQFMPKDLDSKRILAERAKVQALKQVESDERKDSQSYVKFILGNGEHFGIPFTSTRGVVDVAKYVTPPCVPTLISGVINFRGLLISIIDLNAFFSIVDTAKSTGSLVIVSDNQNHLCAFKVNQIQGSDQYYSNENNFEDSSTLLKNKFSNYLLGIHQGEVGILNVNAIISSIKLD